ncbi:hypothetical protein [Spartinivicinus poritis]|uniref:Uncharacterized protein n=1 Tax=Spartinivicinus poritis TaxID=2994640 RepID=A0ABT5UKT1_9GAMM|nr:hypothetical protein [Spartinivicinus sp. A2-2]MDE1465988.1 hypothetical protein [Spartinivicinus sp. A2-2]
MKDLTQQDTKTIIFFLEHYFNDKIKVHHEDENVINYVSMLLDMSLHLHTLINDEESHHALCWLNKKLLDTINPHQKYSDPYPNSLLINNIKSLQMTIDGYKVNSN